MSHEIIYRKQFVKTEEGNIIPLVLQGSSNCTDFTYGKNGKVYERLERRWGNLLPDGVNSHIDLTPEEHLKRAERFKDYGELFRHGSRWVSGSQLTKYMLTGIKSAMTLEEMKSANAGMVVRLRGYVSISSKKADSFSTTTSLDTIIESSEQLSDFLEKAYAYMDANLERNNYVHLKFLSDNPIPYRKYNKAKKERPENFWTIKTANGHFLVRLTRTSAKLGYTKDSAKVFASQIAAEKYISEKRLDTRFKVTFKAVAV